MGRTNSCVKGGGETTDTRPIYQGNRPSNWLKLPDYDNVETDVAYFLVLIEKDSPTVFQIESRYGGEKSLDFGHCENGSFVADYPRYTFSTPSDNSSRQSSYVFLYEDFPLYRNSLYAQVVVRLQGTDSWERLYFHYNSGQVNERKYNKNIVDMINNIRCLRVSTDSSAFTALNAYRVPDLVYAYNLVETTKPLMNGMYIDSVAEYYTASLSSSSGGGSVYTRSVFGKPFKLNSVNGSFRGMANLKELVYDISEVSSFTNPFYQTYSLGKVLFVNYENITSFYSFSLGYNNLTADALEEFFKTLPTVETACTLTCSQSLGYADLTAEQIAIATARNWTLA